MNIQYSHMCVDARAGQEVLDGDMVASLTIIHVNILLLRRSAKNSLKYRRGRSFGSTASENLSVIFLPL